MAWMLLLVIFEEANLLVEYNVHYTHSDAVIAAFKQQPLSTGWLPKVRSGGSGGYRSSNAPHDSTARKLKHLQATHARAARLGN
jgi:hypothetical protein